MYRLLDLHIHPSLKMYYLPYLNASFHARTYCGDHWNPFAFQAQYRKLTAGPTKLLLNAHYVIERGFLKEGIHPLAITLIGPLGRRIYNGIADADPFKTLLAKMDLLEEAVVNTNRKRPKGGKRLKMIVHPKQIDQLADDEVGVVHAIEGSHALGYGPEEGQDKDDYWHIARQRLRFLKQRGVSMLTLGHFWDNMFVPQTDGTEFIPVLENGKLVAKRDDALFHMKRATWRFGDADHLSHEIVRELLDLGILIDVAHSQEHARKPMYEYCRDYKRPIIASHVGVQRFFNHEYNLSDDELRTFHELGGVVGLILSNRLLVDPLRQWKHSGEGIPHIMETVRHIAEITGDVSIIGIGTDFDGLTHPFKDCYTPDMLDRVGDALSAEFSPAQVDDMLWGNSLRALKAGWDGGRLGNEGP